MLKEDTRSFQIMLQILLVESYYSINVIKLYCAICMMFGVFFYLANKMKNEMKSSRSLRWTERLILCDIILLTSHHCGPAQDSSENKLSSSSWCAGCLSDIQMLMLWSWATCPGYQLTCQKGRIEEIRFACLMEPLFSRTIWVIICFS